MYDRVRDVHHLRGPQTPDPNGLGLSVDPGLRHGRQSLPVGTPVDRIGLDGLVQKLRTQVHRKAAR